MTYFSKLNPLSRLLVIKRLVKPILKPTIKSTSTLSLMAAGLLALSGCATTQSLTPQQCQTSNWHELGYADGIQGRSGAYFGYYTNSCANVAGAAPNRILWEQGRQEGLKRYCTELNAYKLGREGYDWQPVCPLEGIEKLEEAYSQGRYYYIRQNVLPLFLYLLMKS